MSPLRMLLELTVKRKGEKGQRKEPKKSEGTLPSEYRPVGTPCKKSIPYGRKLHLRGVLTLLLFPVSTSESPNTNNAGTVMFFGGTCLGDGSDGHGHVQGASDGTG